MNNSVRPDKGMSGQEDGKQRFEQLADRINSAPSHDAIMVLLRDQLLKICGVDMASIFLIDSLKMQLVSWLVLPGESLRKIRIPIDKTSIAGFTASTRELVFIKDPYDREELSRIDPELNFDSSWDRQTGIRTRQILAAPIMMQRSLLGVVQLMNSHEGKVFTDIDKGHIGDLAATLGKTLLRLQHAA